MKTKIYLATDHAGFAYKNIVRDLLEREYVETHEIIDCGSFTHDPVDDYPLYISKAAQAVSLNPTTSKAIIFGGSGQGEAIVANKYPGVRATVYYGGETEILTLSKEHNNANILSIGARFVSEEVLEEVVRLWIQTGFSGTERHARRINQIDELVIKKRKEKNFIQKFINKL